MVRARSRLPIALAAAVVVAQAAVILMRPREGVIEPDPVSARSYFSAAEIERARDFRGPQFALGLGGMLVEAGILVALVVRPPRVLGRASRRPVLVGAAAGAVVIYGKRRSQLILAGLVALGVLLVALTVLASSLFLG